MSLLLCIGYLSGLSACANNLQISEVKMIDGTHVQCRVSWDNAWNLEGLAAPHNHDAVWIFIKYKKADQNWEQAQVLSSKINFEYDSQAVQIATVADQNGFFIQSNRKGSVSLLSAQITIPLAVNFSSGSYELKVFGIEMVWIPQGSFYIGDAWAQQSLSRGDSLKPFYIRSERMIAHGTDSLSLRDTGKSDPKDSIPALFPKGYRGFYCMKYELSQKQYADFLNCLNYTQQIYRTVFAPNSGILTGALAQPLSNRNGISIQSSGVAPSLPAVYACNMNQNEIFNDPSDAENRACNFLNWADLSAYLDWAALRPLSELEFEKVCRGPQYPVAGEFAWGTALSVDANSLIYDATDSEQVNDIITPGAGLASYGYIGPQGPLRVGFAAKSNSTRLESGAAYYGVMEMSGNLWEQCVTVLGKEGLSFDGTLGDGLLNSDGDANTPYWPVNTGIGAGYRGGAWLSGVLANFRDPAVSARFYIGLKPDQRRNTSGGRGAR